jgi:transcriptional regulator with XRE-family HTH domain
MDIRIKFGNKIKELRLKKGLSQEALANLAEIDRTYFPSIEKGKTNVSIVIAEKLANALEVPLKELFD